MTTTTTSSRPWSPTDRDRMIFRWVKFEGYKQSWVAQQLEINQSTVSRILDRYERWIAHGGPAREGGLTSEERLRVERHLVYHRNEKIIQSCLRIAGDMEEHYETSQTTMHSSCHNPSQATQMATTTAVVDRSGKAHRYLSLAHRVGLKQLELVAQDDLPALEPFMVDEHEYAQALEDAKPKYVEVPPYESNAASTTPPVGRGSPDPAPPEPTTHESRSEGPPSERTNPRVLPRSAESNNDDQSQAHDHDSLAPAIQAVHNQESGPSPLTTDSVVTSLEISPNKKPILHAYALPQNPPEPTETLDPIIDATAQEPPPPIRIYPLALPAGAQ